MLALVVRAKQHNHSAIAAPRMDHLNSRTNERHFICLSSNNIKLKSDIRKLVKFLKRYIETKLIDTVNESVLKSM